MREPPGKAPEAPGVGAARLRAGLARALGREIGRPRTPVPGGPGPSGPGRVSELRGARWTDPGRPPRVDPREEAEAARVLALATREGWRVALRGAGVESGPWSGPGPEVEVGTSELDRIEGVEPDDLTVTVGAGVTLGTLREALASHGLWWPCDPPGPHGVTVGGALATGVGGPLAPRYGRPRDLTLGLTLVTGDGRALKLGGRVVKNVAGFDMVRLAVGSRGRLGLIVSATLRLFPRPACRRFFELTGPSLPALLPAAEAVTALPFLPGGALLESPPRDGEPWRLRVRLLGSRQGVAARAHGLGEAVPDMGEVDEDRGVGAFRALREMEGPAPVAVRVEAAPGEVEEVLTRLRALPGWPGARGSGPRLVADLLTGSVRAAGGVPTEPRAWGAALTDLAGALGDRGRVRLVRGPHDVVSAADLGTVGGRVRTLVQGIRRHFDPGGILGPGELP